MSETTSSDTTQTTAPQTTASGDSSNSWYDGSAYSALCATTTTTTTTTTTQQPATTASNDDTVAPDPYQAVMEFLYGPPKNPYWPPNKSGNSNGSSQKSRFQQIFCDCMDQVGQQPDVRTAKQSDISKWNKDFSKCMTDEYNAPPSSGKSSSSSTSTSNTVTSDVVPSKVMHSLHWWNFRSTTSTTSTSTSTSSTSTPWIEADTAADVDIDNAPKNDNNEFAIFALVCWLIGIIIIVFIFSRCLEKMKKLFSSKKNSDYEDIDSQDNHTITFN